MSQGVRDILDLSEAWRRAVWSASSLALAIQCRTARVSSNVSIPVIAFVQFRRRPAADIVLPLKVLVQLNTGFRTRGEMPHARRPSVGSRSGTANAVSGADSDTSRGSRAHSGPLGDICLGPGREKRHSPESPICRRAAPKWRASTTPAIESSRGLSAIKTNVYGHTGAARAARPARKRSDSITTFVQYRWTSPADIVRSLKASRSIRCRSSGWCGARRSVSRSGAHPVTLAIHYRLDPGGTATQRHVAVGVSDGVQRGRGSSRDGAGDAD